MREKIARMFVTAVIVAVFPLLCLWVFLAPDAALAAAGDRACYTIVANSGNAGVAEVFGGTYWAVGIGGAPPDNDLTVYAANFAATYGSGPGFTLSSVGPHVIFTATDSTATSTAASGDDFSPLHTGDYPNSPDGHELPFQAPSVFNADCGDTTPICGNGIVESGEACDAGGANGSCPATCSASCTLNDCSSPTGSASGTVDALGVQVWSSLLTAYVIGLFGAIAVFKAIT